MTREQLDYLSYMLRLWRVSEGEKPPGMEKSVWRASLQDPHTGERIGFADLQALFDFLGHQTGTVRDP